MVEFPYAARTWDETIGETGEGTLVITQDGAKVSSTLTISDLPPVQTSGKFNKKAPQTITGGVIITVMGTGTKPTTGTFTFAEDFTSFEGTATLKNGDQVTLAGSLDT